MPVHAFVDELHLLERAPASRSLGVGTLAAPSSPNAPRENSWMCGGTLRRAVHMATLVLLSTTG